MHINPSRAEEMRQDETVAKQIMRKLPSDVVMIKIDEEFSVDTNEGCMNGNPGDYLAYDEKSGHIWPVAASYVEMHYEVLYDIERMEK